ncbi:MAG: electron transfer flavoprotein subunit alpha/FixB family protein [Planctomycetota bacterium]
MTNIVVLAEQRAGALKKSSFEALAAARGLSPAKITAILCGASAGDAAALADHGAQDILVLTAEAFNLGAPDACARALADEIKSLSPDMVLCTHTAFGRDVAPRVAALLGTSCVTDVTRFEGPLAVRFGHSGKTVIKVKSEGKPAVVTLRPNAFQSSPAPGGGSVRTKALSLGTDLGSVVREILGGGGKVDLGEAAVIVSGGRGLKGPENFKMIEELAAAFGGAVGASRAVVDAGWRPHGEQVGQTGKTVSPTLYVAVGISGAIQHLAGMGSSKYIVAINTDKDAPIFQVADYGIVGDAFEVVPALTAAVKAAKGH